MSAQEDTVFAVASGAGRTAIAVIRISGPASGLVLDAMCRSRRPPPRRASVRTLYDDGGGAMDQALVLWLPGPGSFTGEDCAELHVHGSRAVLRDVSVALSDLGLRPAEPGEFTRRAFLNGRLDLVEAEGLADLVDAETTAQRRQALRQLEGGLGRVLDGWARTLTELLAHQEAMIDFPDEDLPGDMEDHVLRRLQALLGEMRGHLADDRRGERLRQGLVFAILGAPNAGKSTLLNALADREIAIVSPVPGTTRDVLEARVELGGVPVTILDTAGIRPTDDAIEAEGVRRALNSTSTADVLIVVESPWEPAPAPLPEHSRLIRVHTKADLSDDRGGSAQGEDVAVISAHTGQGMPALLSVLTAVARELTFSAGPPPLTRARHRAALRAAVEDLDRAQHAVHPEMRAEDLRLALRALGRITGRVGVEDILDSIFRQFCIGK
jgi:tRNA modification GTPase